MSFLDGVTSGWSGYLSRVQAQPEHVKPFPARPLLAMIERYRGRTVCLQGVDLGAHVHDGLGRPLPFVAGDDGMLVLRIPPALLESLPAPATHVRCEIVARIVGTIGVFHRSGTRVSHHVALLVEAEAVAAPGVGAVVDEAGSLVLLPA